jgi:methylated-DNA-[protein]-cysteine S-methyltransferase
MSSQTATYPTQFTLLDSPIGELLLIGNGRAMTGLYFQNHQHPPKRDASWQQEAEPFQEAIGQLNQYFAGELKEFSLTLAPSGTEFQRAVWTELRSIPFGERRTYGQLAAAMNKPTASRAVGAAIGRNPISILIPCHRVVGTDGSLTGFAGGLDRKKALLEREQTPARSGGLHNKPMN